MTAFKPGQSPPPVKIPMRLVIPSSMHRASAPGRRGEKPLEAPIDRRGFARQSARPMPLMEGLEVIRSPIHGYGVVARRRFAEGDVLLLGDGILYRATDDFDDTYALIVPAYERAPDGGEGEPLFWDLTCQSRWINHSCDPNTMVDTAWEPQARRVRAWWRALRTIEPGEELTYDYAFAAEVAEPCRCGAATCRGLIVDTDDLAALPADLRRHLR
jgi:hypothetical protein